MGEVRKQSTGIDMERWVCPNDRQLALRAKLGAGWSVHTNKQVQTKKTDQLTCEEQEQIMNVIMRSDMLEQVEQERIGRLVEKLDNMKKNAMGDGAAQCILCGDGFGMLGASPTYCDDCKKAVCAKCGVDTFNSSHQPLWLCKICSENRELWKRSGAWFFKGLPKYSTPSKRGSKYTSVLDKTTKTGRPAGTKVGHNQWKKTGYNDSSEQETTSGSEDEEISIGKHKHRPPNESDGQSLRSESTTYDQSDVQRSASSEYSRDDYNNSRVDANLDTSPRHDYDRNGYRDDRYYDSEPRPDVRYERSVSQYDSPQRQQSDPRQSDPRQSDSRQSDSPQRQQSDTRQSDTRQSDTRQSDPRQYDRMNSTMSTKSGSRHRDSRESRDSRDYQYQRQDSATSAPQISRQDSRESRHGDRATDRDHQGDPRQERYDRREPRPAPGSYDDW